MKRQLRQRFWMELALAIASAILLIATVFWKDWIEIVFGVDPDAGSGALEWTIVGITLCLTVSFVMLARAEWRRASLAAA